MLVPCALEHKFVSMIWTLPDCFLTEWWEDVPEYKCWDLLSYDFADLRLSDEIVLVIPSYDDYRAYAAVRYSAAIFDEQSPESFGLLRHAASMTRHEFFNAINGLLAQLHLHLLDAEAKYDYLKRSHGRVLIQELSLDPRIAETVHILPFNCFDRLAVYLKDSSFDLDVMLPRKANNGPGVIQKPKSTFNRSKPTRGKGSDNA